MNMTPDDMDTSTNTGTQPDMPSEMQRFAHDLRNTLSAVYTYAQILRMSLDKPGSENELKLAKSIEESVQDVENLIRTRLDEHKKANRTDPQLAPGSEAGE
jgi:signal transduction histidine kinase